MAKVLKEYKQTLVEVAGHTDITDSEAINQPLPDRRAESVAAYLSSREILPGRIAAFGLSSHYPIASNYSPDGRQLNRRVEITLVPLTG